MLAKKLITCKVASGKFSYQPQLMFLSIVEQVYYWSESALGRLNVWGNQYLSRAIAFYYLLSSVHATGEF